MVSTKPSGAMMTPEPSRSVPSASAVRASAGTVARTATSDSSGLCACAGRARTENRKASRNEADPIPPIPFAKPR